jgi:hypothetical protein
MSCGHRKHRQPCDPLGSGAARGRAALIAETLAWLDRYPGLVR